MNSRPPANSDNICRHEVGRAREHPIAGKIADRAREPGRWPGEYRVPGRLGRGGLAAGHAKGVIHRELTPANMMRASDGVVKLADFGLAKAAELDTGIAQSGAVMGTPTYMSPEQFAGTALDGRSDVYSLGAT